jgi:hypothetical protein
MYFLKLVTGWSHRSGLVGISAPEDAIFSLNGFRALMDCSNSRGGFREQNADKEGLRG